MKVSIVGAAGTVGSCSAFTIAVQGLADEIMLLDTNKNMLMNHVMDISMAALSKNNTIVRAGDYPDMDGTDIVIITAGVHITSATPLRERLEINVPIIQGIARNIEKYCPGAVVITATNPLDLLNYAACFSTSMSRNKFIGYNLNDSIRFRVAIAKALNIQPTRVEAFVLGVHPGTQVMLFSSVKVDGKPVALSENFKKQARDEARNYLTALNALNAGRTAGWTTAVGLAGMVNVIGSDSPQVVPCSVVVDGEYGYNSMSIGLPAVIGKKGITKILEWELPPDEKTELDKAARILKADCEMVKEVLENTKDREN
jgi:malate dehydrogenase